MNLNPLQLLFPPFCVGCGRIGNVICNLCKQTIQRIPQNKLVCPECERPSLDGVTHTGCKKIDCLDGLISFFHYKGVLQHLIKEIKYRFSRTLVRYIDSLLPSDAYQLIQSYGQQAVLIPIPLHKKRLKDRGFNQAALLADLLSKRWNIPIEYKILERNVETMPQAAMHHREEREKQMKHVFIAKPTIHRIVFLVDDVFTTGATLNDAARALKQAGAEMVFGVTIAR